MEPNTTSVPSQPVPQVQPQDISLGMLEGPFSLFKKTWNFFKSNWKLLVPITLLPSVCFAVGQIFSLYGGLVNIIAVALSILGILFSVALQPALVDAIHKLNTGNTTIELVDQYKIGFRLFWSMLLLGIMQVLVSFGATPLFVVPGIIVGIYLSMYLYTFVLEGKKGYESLTESYSLVYGRWFDVLVRLLFAGLVYLVMIIAVALTSFVLSMIFGVESDSTSYMILSLVLNLIFSSVTGTFVMVYLYNVYLSLKTTRIPDVDVSVFKKWLVGFTAFGVVVFIGMILILLMLVKTIRADLLSNTKLPDRFVDQSIDLK